MKKDTTDCKNVTETVIRILTERDGESVSVDELVDNTEINSREKAQVALRRLVRDGKVSQTPDWEYKLATRLRYDHTR